MRNPRVAGLLFLLIGVFALLGNTLDALPAEAFWVGLIAYPVGGYLFFMGSRKVGSRKAIQKTEHRATRALNPGISNRAGQASEQQARNWTPSLAPIQEPAKRERGLAAHGEQVVEDEITLYEVEDPDAVGSGDEFRVSSDVSFPLEIQEQASLADQLDRLHQLLEAGIITAQEFAAAKAKLLG